MPIIIELGWILGEINSIVFCQILVGANLSRMEKFRPRSN